MQAEKSYSFFLSKSKQSSKRSVVELRRKGKRRHRRRAIDLFKKGSRHERGRQEVTV